MILKFLILFTCFIKIAGATDFSDLVERYVKINQEKIKILEANRHRYKGVEIIVADKAESAASRFGHAMLRLIDDDGTWSNDAVISFTALSYEENYNLRRSIFGGYAISPQVMTLHEYWSMYTKDEERDLRRFVVTLPPAQINKLLDTLFKYIREPELLDDYTFLKNNCIGVITKIMVEAGITKKKSALKIPTNIDKWLMKNELALYPEFTMKNHKATANKAKNYDLNEISKDELIQIFTPQELHYLVLNDNSLKEKTVDFLVAYLRKQDVSINGTFNFDPIPQKLYTDNTQEQKLLQKDLLIKIIIHRLDSNESYLAKQLKHLNYNEKTLVQVETIWQSLRSYRFEKMNGEFYLVLKLDERNSGQSKTETIKLPLKTEGKIAVVKGNRSIDFKLISL